MYFVITLVLNVLKLIKNYNNLMSELWFCTREVVSSDDRIFFFLFFEHKKLVFQKPAGIWSWYALIKGSKFNFNMLQAQKHQNWAKLHSKLQKKPKISMIGSRWIYFKDKKIYLNLRIFLISQFLLSKM
jgi:hypothetical protein